MSKADEALTASENWDAFRAAYDARHSRYMEDAAKFNRFYMGDQWDDDVRQKLESQGRPVLTINEILTTVNAVLGEHTNQRVDLRFKPRHSGTDNAAQLLTHVVDHILDQNRYPDQEHQAFADGIIADVGWLDVRMNFERNTLGEVEIRSLDPTDVVLDPQAKEYDPATWSEIFVSRWHTVDEVEALYGKPAANRVKDLVAGGSTFGNESVRFHGMTRFGDDPVTAPTGSDAVRNLRAVRVIERQWKKLARRRVFVDMETGDMSPIPDFWEPGRAESLAGQYGMAVVSMVVPRFRWTASCDHVLLHDEWSPYEFFTPVPFFPFFRRGKFSGLVRQLISPQEQLNKVESQQLHVVNTTANSGWIVEEGSLANMSPEELEQRGAETGLVQVFRRGRAPPAKIQPNQIPTGLDRLGAKALQFIHEISGMEALLGRAPKGEVSGVAMQRSEARGLTKLQPVFTNLGITRRLVAERILRLIQSFYTETRVLRVTDWRDPREHDVEVTLNQEDEAGRVVNDVSVGTYDVIPGTAPARDGALETEFAEALQLRDIGVQVPDEVLIRASHLQNKHEVAEQVMKMQGRGEPTDEEAQMLQMQMELQMQAAQLEIKKLQGQAAKLEAEAALLASKAQNTEMNTQLEPAKTQAEIQLQLERLEFEINKAQMALENKLQLAQAHTGSRNALGVMNMMAKRMDTERKIQGQKEIAQISASVAANRQQPQR